MKRRTGFVEYYIRQQGDAEEDVQGPFSAVRIRTWTKSGKARPDMEFSPDGISWTRGADLPELFGTGTPGAGFQQTVWRLVQRAHRHPVLSILAIVGVIGIAAILIAGSVSTRKVEARFNQDVRGTGFQSMPRVIAELAAVARRAEVEIEEAAAEGRPVSPEHLKQAGLSDAEIAGVVAREPLLVVLRERMIRVMGQHGRLYGREQMGREFADQVARTAETIGPHVRASNTIRGVGNVFMSLTSDALRETR